VAIAVREHVQIARASWKAFRKAVEAKLSKAPDED
jgi:hypothetical protein